MLIEVYPRTREETAGPPRRVVLKGPGIAVAKSAEEDVHRQAVADRWRKKVCKGCAWDSSCSARTDLERALRGRGEIRNYTDPNRMACDAYSKRAPSASDRSLHDLQQCAGSWPSCPFCPSQDNPDLVSPSLEREHEDQIFEREQNRK